jgi:hypothetical protein
MQAPLEATQQLPELQVPLQQSVLLVQLPPMSRQAWHLPAMQASPVQQSLAE